MLRTLAAILALTFVSATAAELPNFVIIFMDDLGYGDIGPFGATGYAKLALAIVFALLIGGLLYWTVERPFLILRDHLGDRARTPLPLIVTGRRGRKVEHAIQ